jgi:O-methyltransferase involved in polyketide biosynthesis
MYLTAYEASALLSELGRNAAPQSRLAVNFAAPPGTGARTDRWRQRFLRALGAAGGEPHRFFLRASEVESFVADAGWHVIRARSLRELAPELLGSTHLRIRAINPEAATAHALRLP